MDWQELLSPVTTCPLGCVEAIMHGAPSHGETVLLAKPSETLQAIIPRLSKVRAAPPPARAGTDRRNARRNARGGERLRRSQLDACSSERRPSLRLRCPSPQPRKPPTNTRHHAPRGAPRQVTGLPVVGLDGRVVGVISRKDIIKVRQQGGSLQERVKAHMTSPAITVTPGTAVEEAGQLMLREGIRRLPVVDADGKPLG